MRQKLLPILVLLALFSSPLEAAPFYGRESLSGLKKYGIAVRVAIAGGLEQHKETFQNHVENRLRDRGIQVAPSGSVVLKLLVNSIQSDDGFYVVHLGMELDQSAFLANNNRLIEAPTWDAWKMGEYREEEILQEVDDLTRQFLNDYIASN